MKRITRKWSGTIAYLILVLSIIAAFAVDVALTTDAVNDRKASCDANIGALNGVERVALAGIRALAPVVAFADPRLSASATQQRATTVKVNDGLLFAAQDAARQEKELRASSYCTSYHLRDSITVPPLEK
jgi:hypothetical protein